MPRSKSKPETLVVDASVAVKWFLPEPDAEPAVALLRAGHRLIAPDLLWIEVASVLWKVVRRGSLTAGPARGATLPAARSAPAAGWLLVYCRSVTRRRAASPGLSCRRDGVESGDHPNRLVE